MSESELLAVASRLHVLLRRKVNRITDIVWMTQNADYAREVLRLARADPDTELHELAARFETIAFTPGPHALRAPGPGAEAGRDPTRHYIGSLR